MCDFVEEAMFEQILRERNLERKRLYLERCLKQQKTLAVTKEQQAEQPVLAGRA